MTMRLMRVLAVVVALLLTGCGATDTSQDRAVASGSDRAVSTFTGTWLGPDGQPAERDGRSRDMKYELVVFPGPDHCEWQSVAYMKAGWPLGTTIAIGPDQPRPRTFLRDAEDVFQDPELQAGLQLDSTLPEGSANTGFRTGDVELWLDPDQGEEYVYLKGQRWPHDLQPPACA
jgi:hypothetical protein